MKRIFILISFCMIIVTTTQNAANASSRFNIESTNINTLQTSIKNQTMTCEKIIETYLDRIRTYNLAVNEAPPMNALTEINPYAKSQARELDDYFIQHKTLKGSLHCVPIIIKDNINTKDMSTTGGSFSLLGNQPNRDAFLVQKLRQAGAILIAKGGMDEFGWGLTGINSRTGRIGNAYDTRRNPGGSSGGVAAGVAANFALLGIGSDNSGSIRIPAAFNGVLGLRPSTGLVSQQGIIPMGNLDAVAGPMAKTVTDLAIALQVIATEPDPSDPKTASIPRHNSYATSLNKNALQGKRIAVVRKIGKRDLYRNFPQDAEKLFSTSLQRMKNLGAVIIPDIDFPDFIVDRKHNQAGQREDIDEYLASFPSTRQNFQDICASNRTRTFGSVSECMHFLQNLPSRSSQEYQQVLHVMAQNKLYVENIFQQYQLDALVVPVSQSGSATYDIYQLNTWLAPLASNAGLPSLVLNIGVNNEGMPVGIEMISKQYHEDLLLAMAYAYEQSAPKLKPPTLIGSQKSLPAYSIVDMNNLITLLGSQAYETVLKEGQAKDLTAEKFKKMMVPLANEF